MFENGYISSEHLIQYQAAELFCKNLCLCVNLIIAFNMYPNIAIITLNGMMRICHCFQTNFAWEFYNHATRLNTINEES